MGVPENMSTHAYADLQRLALWLLRRERPGHTLSATALVHEAVLPLLSADRLEVSGTTHFISLASRTMRRVLINHAEARKAIRRGGDRVRVALDDSVASPGESMQDAILQLEDVIARLRHVCAPAADVLELRIYRDMTYETISVRLGLSLHDVSNLRRFAAAFLASETAP